MKILTVDDSRMIRTLIKRVIDSLGYEALEAENPKEALFVLMRDSADIGLILLDWNMPEMSGIEFLEIIKKDEKYKHIPVIMLTSQGTKDKILQAINAGAINYVVKPFEQNDLKKRIIDSIKI